MLEKEIEKYLVWHVETAGGMAYKFASPSQRGVADRVVCMPDGQTWFIELKRPQGRLSELQQLFAKEMKVLNQKYACLWSKEMVDAWIKAVSERRV
jgi:hypothetical protein